jgi:colicin import membrane protein
MRASSYSDSDIVEAGHQVLASGEDVTGWRIRKLLGGGKPERLQAVWDRRQDDSTSPISAVLPEELNEGIETIMKTMGGQLRAMFAQIHSNLVEKAEQRVSATELVMTEARDRHDQLQAQASAELDRLEALISDFESVIAIQNEKHDALTNALTLSSVELAHFKERSANSELLTEQLRAELSNQKLHSEELTQKVSTQSGLLSASEQRAIDLQLFLVTRSTELEVARRHEQSARERESVNAGQISVLERERVNDAVVTQKLRKELLITSNSLASTGADLLAATDQLASKSAELEASKILIRDLEIAAASKAKK